ncbi:MAG: carboxypeptidase-like regulatory domain-containing protein, partial [Bacteroidota bacterium]
MEGNVFDSITKNALKDVNIYIQELNKGIATDSSGYFVFKLSKKKVYTISASHLGYKDYNKKISLNSDQYITISLSSISYINKEIKIKADKGNANINSTKTGEKKLTIKKIKNLPVFMGEIDPLKTIQLLPGIQSAGTSMGGGLNIRGGSPGQNMILLDNANIFNPYHLMGFFSVFNGDAIEHVNLIKSGIPAEYGGRLSSILEIKSKKGDFSHYNVNGGIGFISSKLTIDGPVIQNKASFCISRRRTYLDFLKPLAEGLIDQSTLISMATDYFFYDLSGKLSLILSPKDYMYLTVYNGNDRYVNGMSSNKTGISWGNSIASIQWKHIWNNKNSYDHNVSWSNYRFNFLTAQQNYFLSFNSG